MELRLILPGKGMASPDSMRSSLCTLARDIVRQHTSTVPKTQNEWHEFCNGYGLIKHLSHRTMQSTLPQRRTR